MSMGELKEIMMRIESESGLRAFEMYMDLKWAMFWKGIAVNTLIVLFFLSVTILGLMALHAAGKAEAEKEKMESEGAES